MKARSILGMRSSFSIRRFAERLKSISTPRAGLVYGKKH